MGNCQRWHICRHLWLGQMCQLMPPSGSSMAQGCKLSGEQLQVGGGEIASTGRSTGRRNWVGPASLRHPVRCNAAQKGIH
eukprot:2127519-Karenia_brevis.AAC.1